MDINFFLPLNKKSFKKIEHWSKIKNKEIQKLILMIINTEIPTLLIIKSNLFFKTDDFFVWCSVLLNTFLKDINFKGDFFSGMFHFDFVSHSQFVVFSAGLIVYLD